jgi:membrane protease YdiL (CAAX protease family)
LRYSWLRKWGAIIVTAIAWSSLHIQYGYRELLMILALGMLLGYARIRTGSLWLCVLLHAITNSIACIQLLIYLKWFQN